MSINENLLAISLGCYPNPSLWSQGSVREGYLELITFGSEMLG